MLIRLPGGQWVDPRTVNSINPTLDRDQQPVVFVNRFGLPAARVHVTAANGGWLLFDLQEARETAAVIAEEVNKATIGLT